MAFDAAAATFFDPFALSFFDEAVDGEERYINVGQDLVGRILLVVYTFRDDVVRIISARKATSGESMAYGERI